MPRKKTDISFMSFWDAYALKRDRIAAERAWNRLSDKDRRAALSGISAYREECQRTGVSMMYAQGYISHRRWEDEVQEPAEPQCDTPPEKDVPDGMDIW